MLVFDPEKTRMHECPGGCVCHFFGNAPPQTLSGCCSECGCPKNPEAWARIGKPITLEIGTKMGMIMN